MFRLEATKAALLGSPSVAKVQLPPLATHPDELSKLKWRVARG